MNMSGYKCALLCTVALLASCMSHKNSVLQAKVDTMAACEKIDGLVSAYTDNFNALKGMEISKRYMGIWSAKVNAMGQDCQVWLSGDKKASYMCSRSAPSEEVAMGWFDDAMAVMGPCLSDWKQEKLKRKDGPGLRTVWSKPGNYPAVTAHVFPVRGKHWSVYVFVGDRDDRF